MLVDPSVAVAQQVVRRRVNLPLENARGEESFWTSGPVDEAASVMSALWGIPVSVRALPRE